MKFTQHLSLVALFGSFAVAVPANILSLTLSLKEGDAVTHERKVDLFNICLRVCWPEQHQCALGSYAHKTGDCWTCCHCPSAPKPDDTAESPALAVQTEVDNLKESPALVTPCNKDVFKKNEVHDICLLICASQPMKCAPGWYGQGRGECYTCCRCSSAFEDPHASLAEVASLPAAHKETKPGL